jgi:hypothetical protein
MPMKRKYRRKSRKPRKTIRRKYAPKGKGGTFRSKVKKALMSISETKNIGRVLNQQITIGNFESEWAKNNLIFPDNGDPSMWIQQGTDANDRIGNRITLQGIRIPMYFVNQSPETLRIRVLIVKHKRSIDMAFGAITGTSWFMDPLGNAQGFNQTDPWQADWPFNKEHGTVVKQRTFNLNGSIDWGAIAVPPFVHSRAVQFTGNSGMKRLEMGFKLRRKQYFDDIGGEIRNVDQYSQYVFVWRLHNNTIPYEGSHNGEGLGNLQIKQFHKVYFKDV